MTMHTVKDVAKALGLNESSFYTQYVNSGIIKETGWFGNSRYWDDAGIVQAAVALNEHQKVREERREAKRKARLAGAQVLAEKFKIGMTLEEIGAQEGITRERVRQHLSSVGVKGADGGRRVRALSNSAYNAKVKVERREDHCLKSYGCTFAEFCAITNTVTLSRHKGNRLISLWWGNKTSAQRQGVPWQFTLPQYVTLLNGREHLFKREREGLVLGRKDKTGPFSPENCEFITLAQNSAWTGGLKVAHAKREELAKKVKALADSGLSLPTIAKQFKCSRAWISNLIATAKRMESEERRDA